MVEEGKVEGMMGEGGGGDEANKMVGGTSSREND